MDARPSVRPLDWCSGNLHSLVWDVRSAPSRAHAALVLGRNVLSMGIVLRFLPHFSDAVRDERTKLQWREPHLERVCAVRPRLLAPRDLERRLFDVSPELEHAISPPFARVLNLPAPSAPGLCALKPNLATFALGPNAHLCRKLHPLKPKPTHICAQPVRTATATARLLTFMLGPSEHAKRDTGRIGN